MFNNEQPLGLPQGSVRAVLALGIVGAFVAGLVNIEVATLILGTYFGVRPNS